jgi:hypothetical protein
MEKERRMLTRLTVNLYTWIIEIYMWFTLVIAGVVGYYFTVPVLNAAGAMLEHEAAWKIFGAVFCAVAMFLMMAVVAGPILVLFDIRKSVRALEPKSTGSGSRGSSRRVLPPELIEPFL